MMTRVQASSLFGDFDMFGWAETPEEENDREIANLEGSMEATRRKLQETRNRGERDWFFCRCYCYWVE